MPDETGQITITVRKNGPYFIHPDDVAKVRLIDHEGNPVPIPGKSITLCRCGASATKPFCDRSHTRIGFQAAEEARREFDAQQGAQQSATESTPSPGSPPAPSSQGDGDERQR